MRTWTLIFLAVGGGVLALGLLDVDSLPLLLGRLAFTIAVLAALLAGIRSVTLQMAELSAKLPRRGPPVRTARRATREARQAEVDPGSGRRRRANPAPCARHGEGTGHSTPQRERVAPRTNSGAR